jgi:hypothetical protein
VLTVEERHFALKQAHSCASGSQDRPPASRECVSNVWVSNKESKLHSLAQITYHHHPQGPPQPPQPQPQSPQPQPGPQPPQ